MILRADSEEMLASVVVLGLATAALASVLRKAPWWPAAWLTKKPLDCPLCMSLWSALAVVVTVSAFEGGVEWSLPGAFMFLVIWGAVTALSLFVVSMSGVFTTADALFTTPPVTPDAAVPSSGDSPKQ